jgi:hypothetical protein
MVVLAPRFHDAAGVDDAQEPVLVEALVAQPTVEALAVGILDRLARIDEVQGDRVLVRPLLHRPADQFGAMVKDELHRAFPLSEETGQDPDDPGAWQARIHLERQRFAGSDVNDAQQPDRASGGERIPEETECLLLIGPLGWSGATPQDGHQGLARAPAHC